MIHVIALITARPGQRKALLQAFSEVIPTVHAEQGCIEYGPVVDAEGAGDIQTPLGEDTFMVVEKWETMAHLQAHSAAPHMAAYAKKARDMIADRVIHVLSPAA
jgi:quinol monooxygenase YgiN